MKRSVLLKIIFFISLNYLDHINVGHVTYSFRIMLFISTGIVDDKLRPQMLPVVPTSNAPLICDGNVTDCLLMVY